MTFHSKGYTTAPGSSQQAPNLKIVTRVSGPEVGYVATPIIAVDCAAVLLEERVRRARGHASGPRGRGAASAAC